MSEHASSASRSRRRVARSGARGGTRSWPSLVAVALAVCSLFAAPTPTTAALPAAPTLAGPADGAQVTIPLTISWTAAGDTTGLGGYNWEVSRTADFASVIERNPRLLVGAATTSDIVSGLANGVYFWRVQGVSRTLEPGAWSPPRTFTVTGAGAGVPGTAVLDPPLNATQFHSWENITFTWSPVPGAVDYILQESTDPAFPVDTRVRQVNIPGPTTTISFNPSIQGNFSARVIAVGADNLMGTPSNVVQFSVADANPFPAPPTLLGPAAGAALQLPLTLSWTHVSNHQDLGYQVQISSSSSFATVEASYAVTDNSKLVPSLTTGTKFWRVRSQHGYIGPTEAYTAWSATGTFTVQATPLRMAEVWFPPTKFSGGEARGSVALTGPAPSGGATVTFSTSHPSLLPELPDFREIVAGETSRDVLVAPTGFPNSLRGMRVGYVTVPTDVTVTATYNGTSTSTTIRLLPPRLNDTPLQLAPLQMTGGADSSGIVDLEVGCFAGFCDGLAPPGGFPVSLTSSSPSVTVPATFTLLEGQGGNSFPIQTSPVTKVTHVAITARAGDASASWRLTLTPAPEPDSLTLQPASTDNGSQGQVLIPSSAIAGHDQLVRVTSSNPAVASVPEFGTILASTTLGRFDITTHPVSSATVVTISVTGGGVTRSANLTVFPSLPTLTALTVTPTSVPGGTSATGTVTLAGAAPSGGVAVSLGSNLPGSASVPPTVTVPAGATSASFTVTTFPVDNTTVQLSATLGSVTQFASLGITRASGLNTLALSPSIVAGGNSSTGTVTLTDPAPAGGTVVMLTDDSAVATTPGSVTVAAGATSRTFTITTTAVTTQTPVVVTASSGGVTRSATLTVNPPTPVAPTLVSPASGATGVAQPVTLDWNDVPGATSYEVRVDDSSTMAAPYVANPTVTSSQTTLTGLPARQLWWRVRARNSAGTFGPFSSTRSFTPAAVAATPSLSAVSVSPASVVGGNASNGIVTLTAAAPAGGAVVTLSTSSTTVTAPPSVTVAAGATSAAFTATTATVTAQVAVNITANWNGVSRTTTLTVTPVSTGGTLAAPSLLSPANDARFNSGQTITFDWSDIAGAAGYTIQIDDQDTFSSPIVNQSVTVSNYATSTLPVTRMWFRARAVDASGNPGAWSAARRFEVR
jgi:hypothetical protein